MKNDRLADLGLLFARLALAAVMLIHGTPKMIPGGPNGDWPGFSAQIELFEQNLGIPPLFAVLAIFAEFLGGIGILLGLLTRLAAFGIACTMGFALYTLIAANQPLERMELPGAMLLIALCLLCTGAGGKSLDGAWFGRKGNK